MPAWLKPTLWGAAAGAAALAILGFGWGGWVTGGAAEQMAKERSQQAVVAALTPICLEQSKVDPDQEVRLAALKRASFYQRRDTLMDFGWATMPGSSDPDRAVAEACLMQLAKTFK